jgi:lipopolysaccharide/colanic/teichoic acid biosynthesis glycosyltransferase
LRAVVASLGVVERVIALAALVLMLPLLAVVAAIIWILSGATPLVAHRRVGRFGKLFWMLKFRTMWDGRRRGGFGWVELLAESNVPERKIGGDARVTSAFARFCRKHSIDELPQLWHVATGQMSLVGPRPVTAVEWRRYYGDGSGEVLLVKPGLTGLWQTRGRNRLTYRQRRRLDLFLARHYCLLLYLRILGSTLPRVIAGRDAY